MAKVLISTSTFAEFDKTALDPLMEAGLSCILNPHRRTLKPEEIVELGKDVIGVIAGTERLDGDILSRLPALKVISRCGAGVDNVDLKAAQKKGIKVYSTPDAPTEAVAELTVGLILNLLRKVNLMGGRMKDGVWNKLMGNLLQGKTVGLVGFGRIGQRVAELLRPFGCDVVYADPVVEKTLHGAKRAPLEALLADADIVSMHASTGSRILGAKEIRIMKEGAWIVNTSRGGVVDEKALYDALKADRLSGAALDVFEEEPYSGAIAGLENVVLTPHVGSYAREARITMESEAVKNLLKGLEVVK